MMHDAWRFQKNNWKMQREAQICNGKSIHSNFEFWEEEAQDPPPGAAESEPTKQQDPDPKSPTSKDDDVAGERERERIHIMVAPKYGDI
jgi:hypothetical protein